MKKQNKEILKLIFRIKKLKIDFLKNILFLFLFFLLSLISFINFLDADNAFKIFFLLILLTNYLFYILAFVNCYFIIEEFLEIKREARRLK